MNLLPLNKNITRGLSEYDMQKQVDNYIKNTKFYKIDNKYPYKKILLQPDIFREIHNGNIGRISDHVIYFSPKRIINIECKLTAIDCVIKQAKDHLLWADYSIIIIPPDITYVTNKHFQEILDSGIGLTYWFNNIGLFEFILPRKSKQINQFIRNDMIRFIESIKLEIIKEQQ